MNIESPDKITSEELFEAISESITDGRMPIFVTDDDFSEVEWAWSMLKGLTFDFVMVTESEIAHRRNICCDEECALFSLTQPRLPGAEVRISRRRPQDDGSDWITSDLRMTKADPFREDE
jgi:hypothetical protein